MEKILGLNKHQVELRTYEKEWKKIFAETKEMLGDILSDFNLRIEHIGSTAIEHLDSKPILDIAIGLSDMRYVAKIRSILEEHNFLYRGDTRDDGEFLFVIEIEQDVRSHHIHIVDMNSVQWSNYLYFRDKLQSDEGLRKTYQNLKRSLKKQYKDDRRGYTNGKSEFISQVLKENKVDE